LASLLQTINGDLDRLRAASTIDVALLSTQLDELSNLVSEAALLVPDDAVPEPVPAPPGAAPTAPPDSGDNGYIDPNAPWRSDDGRLGTEWCSTCRTRGSP